LADILVGITVAINILFNDAVTAKTKVLFADMYFMELLFLYPVQLNLSFVEVIIAAAASIPLVFGFF
jgi:hypothetical protein